MVQKVIYYVILIANVQIHTAKHKLVDKFLNDQNMSLVKKINILGVAYYFIVCILLFKIVWCVIRIFILVFD